MRILSKDEATTVEWLYIPWRSYKILGTELASNGDETPLAIAAAVRVVEAMYSEGYAVVKLDGREVPPDSIDLDQVARLIVGVSGLAEITSGELHNELVNMLEGPPKVKIGQVWLGATGNRMVIREVKDGRARLSYEDDPGDETWEDCEDIRTAFTPIKKGGV